MKNNNKKVIRRLSNRSLRKNRMRNSFVIAAIILTSLLFTTIFSFGAGILQITEEQTMRQIGTRAHAGLKNVTQEQYDKMVSHPLVKEYSYNILVGMADNKELAKRQTEIRYTQKKDLEFGFVQLIKGKLPEKENEIVADTTVMDLLGVPHEVGAALTLSYSFMGKERQDSFIISGWYQGDMIAGASELYISQAYLGQISEGYTEQDFVKSYKTTYTGVGLIQGDLMFRNSRNIEEKVQKVITESGYSTEEISYGINWAYFSESMQDIDIFSVIMLVAALIVIMFTGYLIIYNIFQISIISDIRYYGLLKTIGATRKQIRTLVIRQALILSGIGIPLGLLLGFSVANVGMPVLLASLDSPMSITNFHLKANPYLFFFSALFSLGTVLVSSRKPGKIAGSVSPVEAVKYSEINTVKRKEKKSLRGARLSRMALSNLRRNRRKTVFTILSLSLSVILFTEVITFGKSFSMDQYIETMLTGDFMISSVALTNMNSQEGVELPEDFHKEADAQEGIERSACMYSTKQSVSHMLSEKGHQRFKEFYDQKLLTVYDSDIYSDIPMITGVIEDNDPIKEIRYAYDEALLEKLKVLEGRIDIEKFRSGNYVLIAVYPDMEESFYQPGDKIKLDYHTAASEQEMIYDKEGNYKQYIWINDTQKEYEVMAVVDIPHGMTLRRYTSNSVTTILPLEEFLSEDEDAMCFCASYWVKDDREAEFQSFLENYTTRVDPNTNYESKETFRGEMDSMNRSINMVGGALSLIIGLIGILNFINSMVTSVIARKRELAMLQSIGLTDSQLKRMLVYEGIYYIAFTAVISIVIGSAFSLLVVRALKNVVAYFEYQFTALPFAVILPVFLLIGILVPEIVYRRAKRQSIIMRLREAE